MLVAKLSSKSAGILELIAQGCTYTQIMNHSPDLRLPDIFEAAAEALHVLSEQPGADKSKRVFPRLTEGADSWTNRMAEIKAQSPRAYAAWSPEEDQKLTKLFKGAIPHDQIARQLQRQPSAIQSRIHYLKLGV